MNKANLRACGQEVTAYFNVVYNGKGLRPCYYCSAANCQVLAIDLTNVIKDGVAVTKGSKIWSNTKANLALAMLQGRALCEQGSTCEDRLLEEQQKRLTRFKIIVSH